MMARQGLMGVHRNVREIDELVDGAHPMISRHVTLQAELVEQRLLATTCSPIIAPPSAQDD